MVKLNADQLHDIYNSVALDPENIVVRMRSVDTLAKDLLDNYSELVSTHDEAWSLANARVQTYLNQCLKRPTLPVIMEAKPFSSSKKMTPQELHVILMTKNYHPTKDWWQRAYKKNQSYLKWNKLKEN